MCDLFACPDPASSVSVGIPEAVGGDGGVTFYRIRVAVAQQAEWTVSRRYRDFAKLHESLVADACVEKDCLPQKKLLGNRDPNFIMKRRKELESYLQSVFSFLCDAMPDSLASFLLLDEYEVNFVLRRLAAEHFDRVAASSEPAESDVADAVDGGRVGVTFAKTSPSKRLTETAEEALEAVDGAMNASARSGDSLEAFEEDWTPLELHAISERLKSSRPPPNDHDGRRHDFANVADQCCQMTSLKVTSSNSSLGTSNIIPNKLKFDFSAFKSLSHLSLVALPCRGTVSSLGGVRNTLRRLSARRCSLGRLTDVLACEEDEELALEEADEERRDRLAWKALEELDLANNDISEIDRSVEILCPRLRILSLSGNRISEIKNVAGLANLTELNLSSNVIEDAQGLNARLGQLSRLNLAENKIKDLSGFSKLYSLQHLNMATNRVSALSDVAPVSGLPCLESLTLQGNKVTSVVDYRIKVFELFGKRCSELCLDNETPSQAEVDKVSVLMALRVAREGRDPTTLFGNLPRRVTN